MLSFVNRISFSIYIKTSGAIQVFVTEYTSFLKFSWTHCMYVTVHTIIKYETLFHLYSWIGMLLYSYWAMTSGRR